MIFTTISLTDGGVRHLVSPLYRKTACGLSFYTHEQENAQTHDGGAELLRLSVTCRNCRRASAYRALDERLLNTLTYDTGEAVEREQGRSGAPDDAPATESAPPITEIEWVLRVQVPVGRDKNPVALIKQWIGDADVVVESVRGVSNA